MAEPFELNPLPWEENALEPVISAKTISFHYHKHHATYVKTLNELVAGKSYADMPLERIVQQTSEASDPADKKIFNNAGQIWNHDFYWRSLSPKPVAPAGDLAQAIERDFGGTDALVKELVAAGKDQFGSGWAWLISRKGKLSVSKTGNAKTPMAKAVNCLLTVDVWEHAYYLDYQNERPRYLETVLSKILNWEFAARNLDREDSPVRPAAE